MQYTLKRIVDIHPEWMEQCICFDNDNLSMFIADAYATWNRLLSAARIWLLARAGSSLMGAD